MATYTILLAMAAAGYAGAPGWVVIAGAAGLTFAGWRPWRLGRKARAAWSSKTRTYFVTGVVMDLVLAALALEAGRLLRTVVG
jgi:hypothetical protein